MSNKIKCRLCNKELTITESFEHMKTHDEKEILAYLNAMDGKDAQTFKNVPEICHYCSGLMPNKSGLSMEIIRHDTDQTMTINLCINCGIVELKRVLEKSKESPAVKFMTEMLDKSGLSEAEINVLKKRGTIEK